MAISLGSLFVDLKVNTAEYLQGMTKAAVSAKAFGRDIEIGFSKMGALMAPLGEIGQRLAMVFETVGVASRGALSEIGKSGALIGGLAGLTGGAAALGGTLFALAEKSADVGAKIYEASEKTGITATQMSGLMAITKETGGDFDSLTVSLARAGANLQKAIIEPGGATGKILSQIMGGAAKLSADGWKPMGDRLQDVLKHIFELNNIGERNVALSALLGKGWMNNIETLKLLAEQGYGPAITQAQKLGILFDQDGARQAKQFQIAMKDLQGELAGVGLAFGQKLIPEMKSFLQHLVSTAPYLEAIGLRILAVQAAMTGVGIPLAIKMWKEAGDKFKEVDQIETNFLDHINKLTAGEKKQGDETSKLTGAHKALADGLANLISQEQKQLDMMRVDGNYAAQIGVEYRHTLENIRAMVAAGGSLKESLQATGLAWDIYYQKISKTGGLPKTLMEEPPAGAKPLAELDLTARRAVPYAPEAKIATPKEWASIRGDAGGLLVTQRALTKEEDLSAASLDKLSKAFPGLDTGMIAATASGRKMIDMLTKMDALGNFSNQFKTMTDRMILDGNNWGGSLVRIMDSSIGGIEDRFVEMAVKGKANFQDLFQSIEAGLLKLAMQKGVASLFSKLFSPADGSDTGTGGGGLGSALGSVGKSLASVFGGLLAGGGDVTPGKAYIVGEKHPEFFLPKQSGVVVPSLRAQQLRPMVVNQSWNITTPDPDSFRRAQSQVIGDAYRGMAIAHARNS